MTRWFNLLPPATISPKTLSEASSPGGLLDGGYSHVSNLDFPAGYTYILQFVVHDLTFGFKRAELTLRSLYGPDRNSIAISPHGKLPEGIQTIPNSVPDLPRCLKKPLIADLRNSMTLMLAQIHGAMIRVHNKISEESARECSRSARCAIRTRTSFSRLYQWLILNDLLPRIIGLEAVKRIANNRNPKITFEKSGIPIEALSALQFGHALVKPRYRLNSTTSAILFTTPDTYDSHDLRGRQLSSELAIDWSHFFPVDNPVYVQHASRLRPSLCRPLFFFPTSSDKTPKTCALPKLTIDHEVAWGMPSGESIAESLGFEPLSRHKGWLRSSDKIDTVNSLWCYVLREAAEHGRGLQLGPVGGELVGHAIIDALRDVNGTLPCYLFTKNSLFFCRDRMINTFGELVFIASQDDSSIVWNESDSDQSIF